MQQDENGRSFFTVVQAARYLDKTENQIRYQIAEGNIACNKANRLWRIYPADLDDFAKHMDAPRKPYPHRSKYQ